MSDVESERDSKLKGVLISVVVVLLNISEKGLLIA
jgi:hypothetical protein